MAEWKKEYEKCKEDEAYFFENYCLINHKKPGKYTVEKFKKYIDTAKAHRRGKLRRAAWNVMPYLLERLERPITPEEAFPQIELLYEDDEQTITWT